MTDKPDDDRPQRLAAWVISICLCTLFIVGTAALIVVIIGAVT